MQRPTRAVPALFLFITLAVFLWVYDGYTEGHSTPNAVFILPPLGVMALAGLVDPRLLWSVGPNRHSMPKYVRVTGAVLFAIGLCISAAHLFFAPKL
jgi:hypothetical protein